MQRYANSGAKIPISTTKDTRKIRNSAVLRQSIPGFLFRTSATVKHHSLCILDPSSASFPELAKPLSNCYCNGHTGSLACKHARSGEKKSTKSETRPIPATTYQTSRIEAPSTHRVHASVKHKSPVRLRVGPSVGRGGRSRHPPFIATIHPWTNTAEIRTFQQTGELAAVPHQVTTVTMAEA